MDRLDNDRVRVDETFEGQPVWSGEVLVSELLGHLTESPVATPGKCGRGSSDPCEDKAVGVILRRPASGRP